MAEKRSPSSGYTRYSALGIQYTLTIVLFTYGGYWLENRYDFSPWGTAIGAGLGFLGGTVWLYNQIYHTPSTSSSAEDSDSDPEPRER